MRRRAVGFIAAILAAFMAFGTTESLAGVKDVNGASVYVAEDPDNILGIAADFGVFVKKANFTGDAECNFACNELTDGNDIKPNSKGTIYIKNYNVDNEIHHFEASNRFYNSKPYLNVYFGNGYTVRKQGNRYFVSGKNFQGDRIFDFNDPGEIKTEGNVPFIDIDTELTRLVSVSAQIAGYKAVGVECDVQDQNDRKLKCTAENNVLNISYNDLVNANQGGRSTTPLYIEGLKGTQRTLIVNVVDIPGDVTTAVTPQIYFGKKNESNTSPDDCYDAASRVLWNFGSFSGTVDVQAYFGGTILAPSAKVSISAGPFVGSIIAQELLKTANEIHQVPPVIKKIKEPTEVTVSITALDGTCCDKDEFGNPASFRLLPGVTVALYKKDAHNKYKKVKNSTQTTKSDAVASWTVKEAGEYCIKEISAPDGFVKTPIKCLFTVTEDENGILRIKTIKGKESNGQSNTGKESDNNTKAAFKLRHYSDSIYMAAYNAGDGNLVKSEYSVTDAKGNSVDVGVAQGLEDNLGNAYDMKESHIKTPGRYAVQLQGENTETKYIDIYLLPNGLYLPVELDENYGDGGIFNKLGKYELTKVKSEAQQHIDQLMKSAPEIFDGCLFYEVGGNNQSAETPDEQPEA